MGICGHVDSGKSTTTGRLIFELGGLPERELEKLKQEAECLGKGSFAFAFYMEDPHALKSNEMAQCSFAPQQPLVCDTFKNCEGLSRVAFMDGNGVVMLGKVISCERKEEAAAGGKKK